MPQVVVIGAGIIGSSIAWRLAQAQIHVTLVDAGRFGGEASWGWRRNARPRLRIR